MEFNKQLRHAGLSGLEGGKTSTYYDCYESKSELQADTKGFSQRKCLVHPSRVIRLFDNGRDFFARNLQTGERQAEARISEQT